MVRNQILCYLFAMLIAYVCTYPYENSIKWVKAPNTQALLLNLVPAGLEANITLFLCRIHKENNTVAGKLSIENGNVKCIVPYTRKPFLTPEFEVI